ncbi:PTPRR phosphatase, partial [Amia calva]|nr:PTPRR phosphatase [Amia calva]
MQGRGAFLAAVYVLLHLKIAGCFSGDNDNFLAIHRRKSERPILIYRHVEDIEKGAGMEAMDKQNIFHSPSHARISKLRPGMMVKSRFPDATDDQTISLLARTDHDLQVENAPVSARHLVTMVLHWLHSSQTTGHPRVPCMLSLVQRKFWWPTLLQDVTRFIAACPICAQSKSPP